MLDSETGTEKEAWHKIVSQMKEAAPIVARVCKKLPKMLYVVDHDGRSAYDMALSEVREAITYVYKQVTYV